MLNVCALKRNPITRFNHVSLDAYKGFYFLNDRICVYPTSYDRGDTEFYNVIYTMALKTENYIKNITK